jgi:hypothetical protein
LPTFHYASLWYFLLPNWYLLYFGAFNKEFKNPEATLYASGDQVHLCFDQLSVISQLNSQEEEIIFVWWASWLLFQVLK